MMKNTMSDEAILRNPRVLRTMAFNDDGTMSGGAINNKVWVVVGGIGQFLLSAGSEYPDV